MPDTSTPYRQHEILKFMVNGNRYAGHSGKAITDHCSVTSSATRAALKRLRTTGYVYYLDGKWYLTTAGRTAAEALA